MVTFNFRCQARIEISNEYVTCGKSGVHELHKAVGSLNEVKTSGINSVQLIPVGVVVEWTNPKSKTFKSGDSFTTTMEITLL